MTRTKAAVSHRTGPLYAIGIEHELASYGMTNGPVPSFQEMLDVYPPDPKAVIIVFQDGQDEKVLRTVDPVTGNWSGQCADCDGSCGEVCPATREVSEVVADVATELEDMVDDLQGPPYDDIPF